MLRKRPARQPAGLNQQQRAAVEVPSGPLLVLAGAGTGKTRVVTHRIARLVSHGTAADRILAVTFTNKAAQEMLQRVAQLLPRRTKSKPLVSTFHSLCVRILRRHITALGYPANFAICAAGDQHSLARQVLKEIRVPEATLTPAQLVHRISAWKSRGIRPAAAMSHADSDRDHLAAAAYRRYQRALKSAAAVDFDDLLLLTVDLLDSAAEVQRQEAGRFDHLLVDEYQDTNALQYRIVRHLAGEHRNLCVVGDDDQSIYGWRGAEVDHILRFVRDWPGAIVVRLEDNYRSTAAILAMANRLIEFNKQRHGKTLRATGPGGLPPRILQFEDGESEAVQIVDDISRRIAAGTKPRDIAILFRTGEQSRPFEAALRRNGVRYVLVGGLSFFDRREVKDTLAYLRLLVNPDDDTALLRVINTPPRGIGVKVAERLIAASLDRQCSVWQVIRDPDQLPPMTSTGRRGLERLAEGLDKFNSLGHGTVQKTLADATRRYIESVGYLQHLQTSSDDPDEAATRTSGVEQVISALGEFAAQNRGGTLAEFLDQMTLGDRLPDDERERELQQNGVLLMTLHAAKGLEFPEVYLVGLEEGLLPHHRSIADGGLGIDEERRLCYVGITRAQRRLTISMALSRMKWGKPHATNPSRFLYEMTGQAEHPKYAAAIGPGNG